MAEPRSGPGVTSASRRKHKIVIQRTGAPTDDGYTTNPGAWANYATEMAAIYYGTGREQREAAQENATQTASFEVLSNSKTRALSVTDRICFPVTDPDPENWPTWDIQAVNEIGSNKGVRITATKAAT
jgi:head-tail adaptor